VHELVALRADAVVLGDAVAAVAVAVPLFAPVVRPTASLQRVVPRRRSRSPVPGMALGHITPASFSIAKACDWLMATPTAIITRIPRLTPSGRCRHSQQTTGINGRSTTYS
jgi:hypothetical protein